MTELCRPSARFLIRPGDKAYACLWVLLLVFGGVYVSQLDAHGFWWDEWMTLQTVGMPFGEMVQERISHGHGPVYFGLLQFWAMVAGVGEPVLRLPSVFFALVSAWLMFQIGARVAGRWTGVMAAGLLLASPTTLWLALQARPYTMAMALLLAGAAWILRCKERPEHWSHAWVLGGLNLLALATHYSAGLFLLGQAAYLITLRKERKDLLTGAVAGCLAALTLAGMTVKTAGSAGPVSWIAPHRWDAVPGLMGQAALSERLAGEWPIGSALAGMLLGLIGAMGVWKARPGKRVLVAFLWGVPLMAAAMLVLGGYPDVAQVPRYFAACLAFEGLAVALALGYWTRHRPAWGIAGLAALTAVCLACGWDVVYRGPEYPYRDVARLIEQTGDADDIVMVSGPHFQLAPWFYYASRSTVNLKDPDRGVVKRFEWASEPAGMDKKLPETVGPNARLWLVPFESGPMKPETRAMLKKLVDDYAVIKEYEVKGRLIFEFERPTMVVGTEMDPSDEQQEDGMPELPVESMPAEPEEEMIGT